MAFTKEQLKRIDAYLDTVDFSPLIEEIKEIRAREARNAARRAARRAAAPKSPSDRVGSRAASGRKHQGAADSSRARAAGKGKPGNKS